MKRTLFVCVLAFGLQFSSAKAVDTFFGEDLGLGESIPLAAWPNADAANVTFLSYLAGVTIEGFESFADGTVLPNPLVFGSVTATLSAPPDAYQPDVEVVPTGSTNGYGRYATEGTHFLATSSDFTISFSEPQVAFGFFGIDVGDFEGTLTLETASRSRSVIIIPHTVDSPGGTVIFFGVIDTDNPFVSVTFGNTGAGVDHFAFDEWTIGGIAQLAGACCHWNMYTCQDSVLETECQGPYDEWTEGVLCADLDPPCTAPTGACCLSDGSCAEISMGECSAVSGSSYKGNGTVCLGDQDADGWDDACPQSAIPAASTWGLITLALVLLISGKIYFGRLRTARTAR